MARVTPPPIDPVPTPPIQRGDRATFSSRVDAFIRWLVNAVTQFQSVATNVYNNAVDAFQSATGAATSATNAGNSATSAGNSATAAQSARDDAQDASAMAMAYALALTAASTTSLVIGTGTKTFTGPGLQAKQFSVGQVLYAVNPDNSAQWMAGTVTAYNSNGASSSLTLNVTDVNPATSGQTVANWTINISGVKGATGANGGVTGGNLTGALNERRATNDVPSAATVDIWSGNGNYVGVTGTATITGFANAPQAGARRRLLALGAFTVTSGANLIVKGGSFTANVGDEIDVYAESVSMFRVTRILATGLRPQTMVITTGSTFTIPAADFTVEVQAGGGGGLSSGNAYGGNSGGYVKKTINGATVGSVAMISVGSKGLAGASPGTGGNSTFVLSGLANIVAASTGASSGGDIIINSVLGGSLSTGASSRINGGSGANSPLGTGALGRPDAANQASGYGAGGAGAGAGAGGTPTIAATDGTPGVIIVTYLG